MPIASLSGFYDLTWPMDRPASDFHPVDPADLSRGMAYFILIWLLAFVPSAIIELVRVLRYGAFAIYTLPSAVWFVCVLCLLTIIAHPIGYEAMDAQGQVAVGRLFIIVILTSSLALTYSFLGPIFDAGTTAHSRRLLLAQSLSLLLAYPAFHRGIVFFYRMHLDFKFQVGC